MVFRSEVRALLHFLQIRGRPAECVYARVKKIRVAGIDAGFDSLEIVRLLEAFRNVAVRLRDAGPLQLRQIRHALWRSHVGPDKTDIFASRVGCRSHFVFECVLRRLVWHIHPGAVDVEFPTMVNASETTVFVTSPEKTGSTVRTEFVE